MMRLWLLVPLTLVMLACGDDENAAVDDPYKSDPNDKMICTGDPDTQVICKKESDFWDCSAMPNGDRKCAHKEVPPGSGTWKCKTQGGKLICSSDKPDAGPPGGGEWSCKKSASGGTDCERVAPVPPGGGTWNCGYDSEFNWACTKKGGSGSGLDAGVADSGGVIVPPPYTGKKICFKPSTTAGLPTPPEGAWAIITANKVLYNKAEALYVRVHFSKAFVDNTYGANSVGWPKEHTFKDLVGSDKGEVFFNNADGDLLMHMAIDYISESKTAKSGYGCLGVSGGDGKLLKGSASDILAAQSSLSVNFNKHGHVLTTDSPATDKSFSPNKTYPNWIFDVWYEVWVKWSVFGTKGPGTVYVTGIHASPSKTGDKTLKVVPVPCP